MKKYIKLISVLVLTVLICMSFCSCKQLDELRLSRAVYGNTEETLYFRGSEYKLLPECEYLNVGNNNYGNITDRDVPVLLSDVVGTNMYFDDNELFITSHRVWATSSNNEAVWCRADIYDSTVEKIESFELDSYCYWDHYYNESKDEYVFEYKLLSRAAVEVIQNTLVGEGIELDSWDRNDISMENIYFCDESLLLVDQTESIVLVENNGEYSFITEPMAEKQGLKLIKYPLTPENADIIRAELGFADDNSVY